MKCIVSLYQQQKEVIVYHLKKKKKHLRIKEHIIDLHKEKKTNILIAQ